MSPVNDISSTDSTSSSQQIPNGSHRAVTTTSSIDTLLVDMLRPSRDYVALSRPVTQEDRKCFREELKKVNRFSGMYWILQDEPIDEPFPWLTVKHILQQYSNKKDILNALKVSNEDIVAIADRTKGQLDNYKWIEMRFGRLIASDFGPLLLASSNTKRAPQSLFSKLVGTMTLEDMKNIQYRTNHIEEAIQTFETKLNVKVTQTGIWLDETGMLAASPDGLLGEEAILEVKCPLKHSSSNAQQILSDKSYCFKDGELDKSHPYYHQIQGQLYILNRSMCYLLVFTPTDSIILEVHKDLEWETNLDKLKEFYVERFLRKLME
ncbi:hypothetical protein WDU94_007573 [Cyamophila willieti]